MEDSFERTSFHRRQPVTLFRTPAWVTTAEDVILHKLHWQKISPSDRQLQDAAGVYTVQGNALDTSYLRQWARSLNVEQELDALLTGHLRPKST
jgi:hypothetical protein